MAKRGNAMAAIFTLNPKTATSQPVMVVPMFAPNIIPADSTKDSNPAFTKLTAITVLAEDDCTKQVLKTVRTPR